MVDFFLLSYLFTIIKNTYWLVLRASFLKAFGEELYLVNDKYLEKKKKSSQWQDTFFSLSLHFSHTNLPPDAQKRNNSLFWENAASSSDFPVMFLHVFSTPSYSIWSSEKYWKCIHIFVLVTCCSCCPHEWCSEPCSVNSSMLWIIMSQQWLLPQRPRAKPMLPTTAWRKCWRRAMKWWSCMLHQQR